MAKWSKLLHVQFSFSHLCRIIIRYRVSEIVAGDLLSLEFGDFHVLLREVPRFTHWLVTILSGLTGNVQINKIQIWVTYYISQKW